jgi:hypothetical protein
LAFSSEWSACFARGSLGECGSCVAAGELACLFDHFSGRRLADFQSLGDLGHGRHLAIHRFEQFRKSAIAQNLHLLARRQLIANVTHKFIFWTGLTGWTG